MYGNKFKIKKSNSNETFLCTKKLIDIEQLLFGDHVVMKTLKSRLEKDYDIKSSDTGLFTPWNTFKVFLNQVLDPKQTCKKAVTAAVAETAALTGKTYSNNTGNYCNARKNFPEELAYCIMKESGTLIHQKANDNWLWHGRPVKIMDGTGLSMPDSKTNQQQYPHPASQLPGVGLPQARLTGILSMATGAVIDAIVGPIKGRGSSEICMARKLLNRLKADDIAVLDSGYASFFFMHELVQGGVDVVVRAKKTPTKCKGHWTRKHDRIVKWKNYQKPDWMNKKLYSKFPDSMVLREIKYGDMIIVTSLLDEKKYPRKDIIKLYLRRYEIETNFRSIKRIMHMDILRCKTPSMVRKEIWMHLIGYNLIRSLMVQSALRYQKDPNRLSFSATLDTLAVYRILLELTLPHRALLYEHFIRLIGSNVVPLRPNRYEPRFVRRRHICKPYMQKERKEYRRELRNKYRNLWKKVA